MSAITDMYLSQEEFHNVCRICLKKSKLEVIYLYKIKDEDNLKQEGDISTLEKMRLCCAIDIYMGDNLPHNICQECYNNLLNAYQLRTLSQNSDLTLREILKSSCVNLTKVKNEKIDRKPKKNIKTKRKLKKVNRKEIIRKQTKLNNEQGDDYVTNSPLVIPEDVDVTEEKYNLKSEEKQYEDEKEPNYNSNRLVECLIKEISKGSNPEYNKYICPICDMQLVNFDLVKHVSTHHNTMTKMGYKCYGCDKILDSNHDRELHENIHCSKTPPGTIYTCSFCMATTENRKDFDKHLWIKHRGTLPPLRKYIRKVVESPTFQNRVIVKNVKSKRKKILKKRMTPQIAECDKKEGFVCETCGKVLQSAGSFNIHIMKHEGTLSLQCPVCPFKSANYCTMIVHKLRHEGRKPFQCRECPYKTDRPECLKVHQMRHSGERPYSCPYCDYKAINSSHLKRHQTKHTNLRDYQCKTCDTNYKCSKSLKQHVMRVHENAKMFYCKPCHTKYVGEEPYKRHMEKKHSDLDGENTRDIS